MGFDQFRTNSSNVWPVGPILHELGRSGVDLDPIRGDPGKNQLMLADSWRCLPPVAICIVMIPSPGPTPIEFGEFARGRAKVRSGAFRTFGQNWALAAWILTGIGAYCAGRYDEADPRSSGSHAEEYQTPIGGHWRRTAPSGVRAALLLPFVRWPH